jgi:hypothetical protein
VGEAPGANGAGRMESVTGAPAMPRPVSWSTTWPAISPVPTAGLGGACGWPGTWPVVDTDNATTTAAKAAAKRLLLGVTGRSLREAKGERQEGKGTAKKAKGPE